VDLTGVRKQRRATFPEPYRAGNSATSVHARYGLRSTRTTSRVAPTNTRSLDTYRRSTRTNVDRGHTHATNDRKPTDLGTTRHRTRDHSVSYRSGPVQRTNGSRYANTRKQHAVSKTSNLRDRAGVAKKPAVRRHQNAVKSRHYGSTKPRIYNRATYRATPRYPKKHYGYYGTSPWAIGLGFFAYNAWCHWGSWYWSISAGFWHSYPYYCNYGFYPYWSWYYYPRLAYYPVYGGTTVVYIDEDDDDEVIVVDSSADEAPVGEVVVYEEEPAVAASNEEELDELLAANGVSGLSIPAERYLTLGDRAFREGRYADAVQFYAKAIEFAPREAALHLVLADALFAAGDYHYAAYAIRRAVELDVTIVDGVVDKHDFYTVPEEFDQQLAVLESYIADYPSDVDAILVLALNQLFGGRPAAAVDLLEGPVAGRLRSDMAAARILDAARRLQYGEPQLSQD
jgi:tetratricopeptide (TPR) repeat protein